MRKQWKDGLRKWMAMGLAACLLAGCGSGGQNQAGGGNTDADQATADVAESAVESAAGETTEADSAKDAITFRIAVQKHALSKLDDFNEKLAFQMAEEATGVHIEWIEVSDGSEEKVNALLTADLPDAFLGLLENENLVVSNMDSLLNLNQDGMLEKYAPHVVADYKTMENGLDLITWPDGSIRSLITTNEVNYENDADGIMVINKAWLDQLGMDIPTTTDEFYEVLCAFRDNDMNGNGDATDEIPLEMSQSNWAAHIMNMANPWGIAGYNSNDESAYLMVKDGKVTPTMDTEEYRAFLEYMNKLAKEGLFDMECFTQTNDQYYTKLKSGIVGCYYAWTPYSNMGEEAAANYVTVPVFRASDDITPYKTGERDRLFGHRTGFEITTACENPERLLEWWDYLSSSTEIKYTMKFGPKGEYWDVDETGNVFQKTPEGLSDDFTIENYKYTNGVVDLCTFIRKDEAITVGKDEAFTTWYRINMVDDVWDQLQTEYLPKRFVDAQKADERVFMESELFEYMANFTATSIMNGVDDAKWNTHLEQLQTLQYYDWIQWYQDFIDGKF